VESWLGGGQGNHRHRPGGGRPTRPISCSNPQNRIRRITAGTRSDLVGEGHLNPDGIEPPASVLSVQMSRLPEISPE
jgi:hypothetical protein